MGDRQKREEDRREKQTEERGRQKREAGRRERPTEEGYRQKGEIGKRGNRQKRWTDKK